MSDSWFPSIISPSSITKHHLPLKSSEPIPHKSSIRPPVFTSTRTRKAFVCAYGFTFLFVSFATFLVLNPSLSEYSFYSTRLHSFLKSATDATYAYRSHISSIFYHFHSNSSSTLLSSHTNSPESDDLALHPAHSDISSTTFTPAFGENEESKRGIRNPSLNDNIANNNSIAVDDSKMRSDGSRNDDPIIGKEEVQQMRENGSAEKGGRRKKRGNKGNRKKRKWVERIKNCDIFDGNWVRDNSYPLFKPGSCPFIDESFNCFVNGRPDNGYERYRWQPKACNVARLNGKDMLEILRGKRLVFVGDSLNRNMWESLVCLLRNSVKNKTRVFEASGREEFRTENSYSFVFEDYNCSVEFFRSNFLVQEWEMPGINGSTRETLRLDLIKRESDNYKTADVLIFNTGHWWTHEKTSSGKDYYQEGDHIYDELNVNDAFVKALKTWARWLETNMDPSRTSIFFRGYSTSHFSGVEWNSGGKCDSEKEPLTNETYFENDPPIVEILDSVLKGMKTQVFYLNVARMTNFRKDAHPSTYRKQNLTEEIRTSHTYIQDCSHWCLPGVPDTWNEIVYTNLLFKHKQKQLQHRRKSHKVNKQTNKTVNGMMQRAA